jgi:hypothetical protein
MAGAEGAAEGTPTSGEAAYRLPQPTGTLASDRNAGGGDVTGKAGATGAAVAAGAVDVPGARDAAAMTGAAGSEANAAAEGWLRPAGPTPSLHCTGWEGKGSSAAAPAGVGNPASGSGAAPHEVPKSAAAGPREVVGKGRTPLAPPACRPDDRGAAESAAEEAAAPLALLLPAATGHGANGIEGKRCATGEPRSGDPPPAPFAHTSGSVLGSRANDAAERGHN